MTRHGEPAQKVGVVVVHGVGPADPGWINKELLSHLVDRARLHLADHSEVHEIEIEAGADSEPAKSGFPAGATAGDLGRDPAEGTVSAKDSFTAYLRRADLTDGRNVTFVELFWADLSRVGRGSVATALVALQMFYEAPLVLSAAFMRGRQTGVRRNLAWLVRAANWVLRGPISGLNISVFLAAIALYLFQAVRRQWPEGALAGVHDAVIAGLALLAIAAGAWALRKVDDDTSILRRDLAPATATYALLLFLGLCAAYAVLGGWRLEGLAALLRLAAMPILLFWAVWSHMVAAGILLLAAMSARWYLPFRRDGLTTPMRAAAALGLTMVQGVIWKVVIALSWSLIIYMLVPGATEIDVCAPPANPDHCALGNLYTELILIVSMNMIMGGILVVTVLALFKVRDWIVKLRHDPKTRNDFWLPRIIVSRLAVVLMFLLTLANLCLFYAPGYAALLREIGLHTEAVLEAAAIARPILHSYRHVLAVVWALVLVLLFFGVVASSANGVLHIVRDLVDHQYTRRAKNPAGGKGGRGGDRRRSRAGILRWAGRDVLEISAGQQLEEKYPRRERIVERFDTLMKKFVLQHDYDQLILVGHSQGSVILYDYLCSGRDDGTLATVERIDVVTLGSPLGHIYAPYFSQYEALQVSTGALNRHLKSWHNLWRVDDPIGNKITLLDDNAIKNDVLNPGGHMDYWCEEKVCALIAELMGVGDGRTTPPPLPRAFQAGTAVRASAI